MADLAAPKARKEMAQQATAFRKSIIPVFKLGLTEVANADTPTDEKSRQINYLVDKLEIFLGFTEELGSTI